jgi:transposase
MKIISIIPQEKMKIEGVELDKLLSDVRKQLKEKKLSPSLKASIELLLSVVILVLNRLKLNSKNSSKAPSSDPNRIKEKKKKSDKKPGGQVGHKGCTLEKFSNPDLITTLKIDRQNLANGDYTDAGYVSKQVVDIDIKRVVTEYRAEKLRDQDGKYHVASFPEHVTQAIQ